MRPLAALNEGKRYRDKIKPYNFLLAAHVAPFGYPPGVNPARFRLVTPFETIARRWRRLPWRNIHAATAQQRATTYTLDAERDDDTASMHVTPASDTARTIGGVLAEYRTHPEAKSGDAEGNPCRTDTMGLLTRLHVQTGAPHFIGKESNLLEAVDEGLIGDAEEVYTEYTPRNALAETLRRRPKSLHLAAVARQAGISEWQLRSIAAGRAHPHRSTATRIQAALRQLVRDRLAERGALPPNWQELSLDALLTELNQQDHALATRAAGRQKRRR